MRFNHVRSLPVLILMMSFLANDVMTIRCYQCRSDLHTDCEENVHVDYLRECHAPRNNNTLYCRKMKQDLYFMSKDRHVTIRECATIHRGEKCYVGRWGNAKVETCDCRQEGCNKGAKRYRVHRVSFFVLLLTALCFQP